MKITKKQLEDLLDYIDVDGIEVEVRNDWTVDHKCEIGSWILKSDNKFYDLQLGRCGDYYSGYDYMLDTYPEEIELPEVELKPVTIYKWERV